ncbi:hypothetical protein GUJ93_ZPchr0008g12125 [Zizania palustris]|uniref:Rapid alkalinization factor 1 n=1 Tax=Zizania palustris TaxID=103762 RepID=A0A8J5V0U5_ZIZPA|nr:hypothetical protein GUJ93_ZPchr0008g12125 [Zizania palustris]
MARGAAIVVAAFALLLALAGAAAAAGEAKTLGSWELGVIGAIAVDGADAFGFPADEEDVAADSSAVVRRVLQQGQRYISTEALRAGSTPCSVRGASYYNCRPGAEANPYTRGCSEITRCRS